MVYIIQVLIINLDKENGSNLKDQLLNNHVEHNKINLRKNHDENNDIRHPFYESYKGGLLGSDMKNVYFIGIIDIFTQYGYFNLIIE